MDIKILEPSDNISQYLECVASLNNSGVSLSNEESIKFALESRPTNILTWVGLVEDNIVATASTIMECKLRYNQLCCHIEDVGVHPSQRGKGYGKEIVDHCIRVAKRNKCYKVKLNCNPNLVDFYGKIGFIDGGMHMILNPIDT
jgi:GNAT superfamily N-acetyltransferase